MSIHYFDEILFHSPRPVLVVFYADHIPASRQWLDWLKQLEPDLLHRFHILQINMEFYPHLCAEHGVFSRPVMMLFLRGRFLRKIEHCSTCSAMLDWISA